MLFHPHLIEFTQEVILVHAHFIFCGMAIVISVISVTFTIRRIEHYVWVEPSKISSCSASSSSLTVETKNMRARVETRRRKIKSIQRRVMGLGIACAVLLIFNVVKVPPYAPLFLSLSLSLSLLINCKSMMEKLINIWHHTLTIN
jgi:hypothetical protein